MNELRNWLLQLANETMKREGAEDAAHDYDHLVRVMALAETIQASEGGDLPTIWAAVQQAIRDHRITGNGIPQTLEGRIVYDADKIDCLAAIGIGRLYCVTGRYNQKVYSPMPDDIVEPIDPLVVRQLRRRPDYSPSIEFQLLFGKLHERMTTNKGRELAQERYTYMRDFFARLRKEVEGEL